MWILWNVFLVVPFALSSLCIFRQHDIYILRYNVSVKMLLNKKNPKTVNAATTESSLLSFILFLIYIPMLVSPSFLWC